MENQPGSFYNVQPDSNPTSYPEEQQGQNGQTIQLKKDPALLAKYSGDGNNNIRVEVDPQGQLSMSGAFNLMKAKADQSAEKSFDAQSRMSEIMREPDPNVRNDMLISFQADMAEKQNKDVQKFKMQADSGLGVPELRNQLIKNESMDKQYGYAGDSPDTVRIRNTLAVAEDRSRGVTKELLLRDPNFAKEYTMVDGFVKNQQRIIAKLEGQSEQNQQKVDQVTSVLTEENIKAFAAMNPGATPDQLKQRAYAFMTNPATKKEAAVLFDPSATPEHYAQAAIAGVDIAKPYVIKEQSLRTGQTPDQVNTSLDKMRLNVENDGAMADAIKKWGTAADKKEFAALLLAHGKDKGTTAAQDWRKVKIGWALAMESKKNQGLLNANVANWQPIDGVSISAVPEIKQLIDQYAARGTPLSVSDLADKYVSAAPKEQQADRLALVQKLYLGNANILNKGLYGQVPVEDMKKRLEARTIGRSFFDDLMEKSAAFGNMVLGATPLSDPFGQQQQPVQEGNRTVSGLIGGQ